MKGFFFGFFTASLLGVAALYAQSNGLISFFPQRGDAREALSTDESTDGEVAADEIKKPKRRRRPGRRRGKARSQRQGAPGANYDTSQVTVGDDLDGRSPRELSMGAGAEEQLGAAEIERGIDRVFRGIQRCLILVPSDAPATGRVTLGMHIAPTGKVTKVNLKGPATIARGEPGACIRKTVRSIRYPSFDGPDMVVHYPIEFE